LRRGYAFIRFQYPHARGLRDGSLARLGELARELSFKRTLIVADRGIVATGLAERAAAILDGAGISTSGFDAFESNPDTRMVEAGRAARRRLRRGLDCGDCGGSSLDCAKGINFVLTNGGRCASIGIWEGVAADAASIGVPTTAGTGSEAQAYALISTPRRTSRWHAAIPKRPSASRSRPGGHRFAASRVTAVAGYDAISHAVESYVTTQGHEISDVFARDAWRLLESHYERVLTEPSDLIARGAMLVGAHEAGIAIDQSMLGATHACANPLTAHYDTPHGLAIAVMLPPVVRWNGPTSDAATGIS